MAAFILLMVTAYLRPGECLALTPRSFVKPRTLGQPWCLLLHPESGGRPSKTGDFDESLLLDARWARWMDPLWAALAAGPADAVASSVWPFSYLDYSKSFKKAADSLKVTLVPYQGRHSGPSIDRYDHVRSAAEVQKRGRWKSLRSVARYEKAALLNQAWSDYKPEVQTWLMARENQIAGIMFGHVKDFGVPPAWQR
jgi:hypothetical protein